MDYQNLNKDDTIKSTVRHLADKFGIENFKIKDHWEDDLCAVGLADISEQYLIYISTYNKNDGEFYVALENLADEGLSYEPAGTFDPVNLKTLEQLFTAHLRIKIMDTKQDL